MHYSKLVEVYEKLESTTKRLEKTKILSDFLKKISDDEIDHLMLLVQGRVFPNWDQRELGVAIKLLIKAIKITTGAEEKKIYDTLKKTGDIGETAEQLVGKKTQSTLFSKELTTKQVFNTLQKLEVMEGEGSVDRKLQLISELLTSAKPKEAKYIIRTIISDLRIGFGEGTVRDAIVWAFFGEELEIKYDEKENKISFPEKDREKYEEYNTKVQGAIDLTNDFVEVAKAAKKGITTVKELSLVLGSPIKVMLYQKAEGIKDAFETVGKPAACEFKFDGFRVQIHKKGNKIKVFTRRLEDVTKQFPDVVEAVEKHVSNDCVLDAEVIGYDVKTKKYLPFQSISQRIRRKYDIHEMVEKFPVEINVFDAIYFDGKNLLKEHFIERRKILEKNLKQKPFVFKLANQLITSEEKEAEEFYKKSLNAGNEGIMMKNLEGIYKPGSRVGYGVKVKPVMETLDLVIVGAEWGSGKRGKWLSSFTIACQNDAGEYLEIGRVGTGFKEKIEEGTSFEEMTELLKPLIISEKENEAMVKPKIVIEIKYEEIQKSPTYSSGYALRFPRLLRLREDKSPEDCTTIKQIEKFYKEQRGRN
ncbi:ATP-dependent DNA ligase [Candidatus Woesearchaeota archaeon]|nr:ATP-dependent DNA ligase [Candidatus Woesearchaeota archaeon]